MRVRVVPSEAVPGHWQGDVLGGATTARIAVLVEEASRFVLLAPAGESLEPTMLALFHRLPAMLHRARNFDRRAKVVLRQPFAVAPTAVMIEPSGAIDATLARLLRRLFPPSIDLSRYSGAQLDKVALLLDQRPRKALGSRTPADVLDALV